MPSLLPVVSVCSPGDPRRLYQVLEEARPQVALLVEGWLIEVGHIRHGFAAGRNASKRAALWERKHVVVPPIAFHAI